MDRAEAAQRIADLRAQIDAHNYAYYVEASPVVSDREYDLLFHELAELEARFPDLARADSPTQRVGGEPLAEFVTRPHAVPMLSIDNVDSPDKLRKFDERLCRDLGVDEVEYTVEPKVDGVSISLRYENGVLEYALTRGNGREGDDVTANVRTIPSIPLRLHTETPPSVLEARGEVFMSKEGFRALNAARQAAGETEFANARNATAGTLKQLDSKVAAQRPLDAVFYAQGELQGVDVRDQETLLALLRRLGLRTQSFTRRVSGFTALWAALQDLEESRHEFAYDIDGAVVKANDFSRRERLGSTARAPSWARAYKFLAARAETRLHDIAVQVGRLGTLTPVAKLEPVFLAGSTISRATLHNFDNIARKDIRIGDVVEIEKAGDVIPAVVRSVKQKRVGSVHVAERPEACPVCSGAVQYVEEEVAIRCLNPECPGKLKESLRHFAHRGAMDIDTLGDALIELLVDEGFVTSPADLYELAPTELERLARFPGLGPKSVANLITAVDESKSSPPWRLLFALGIPFVGAKVSQVLIDRCGGVDEVASCTFEQLTAIPEVGETVAESVAAFFRCGSTEALLQRLRGAGVQFRASRERLPELESWLSGKTCVLTGALQSMTRDEATEILRRMGANVSSTVSSRTDFVIVGENAGSKLAKARQLGVAILVEEDFEAMCRNACGGAGTSDPPAQPGLGL